jgi:hypothetical protein
MPGYDVLFSHNGIYKGEKFSGIDEAYLLIISWGNHKWDF